MAKIARAVQWQIDHFTEIPVLVVACLRLGAREGTAAVRADAACGRIGILGIDLSQRAEPVTRRARHGAGGVSDHLAAVEPDFGAETPQFAGICNPLLHRATRLAARALRADNPQTGRAGNAPRCLRQPPVARLS